jgi:hypothetical protein
MSGDRDIRHQPSAIRKRPFWECGASSPLLHSPRSHPFEARRSCLPRSAGLLCQPSRRAPLLSFVAAGLTRHPASRRTTNASAVPVFFFHVALAFMPALSVTRITTRRPDRSAGAVCQYGAEGSRHNPNATSPLPLFAFRFSSFAFSEPPDPCSLMPGPTQTHLHCRSQHNQIFRHHSLRPGSTIYRVTTYPPVQSSRCYSCLFRLAQHGITQCRGGHA